MFNKIKHFFTSEDSESGAILVMVAVTFSLMLIFVAIVMDLGNGYRRKISLQQAVDATGYEAIKYLPCAEENKLSVEEELTEFMHYNWFKNKSVHIEYEWTDSLDDGYATALRITSTYSMPCGMARLVGIGNANIKATVKAYVTAEATTINTIPIYITKDAAKNLVQYAGFDIGIMDDNSIVASFKRGDVKTPLSTADGTIGLLALATNTDITNYGDASVVPGGITSTVDEIYQSAFANGYVGLNSFNDAGVDTGDEPMFKGITSGSIRNIVTPSDNDDTGFINFKKLAYVGLQERIVNCEETCSVTCNINNRTSSCPRICLIPVVEKIAKTDTVKIISYLPVYITSVEGRKNEVGDGFVDVDLEYLDNAAEIGSVDNYINIFGYVLYDYIDQPLSKEGLNEFAEYRTGLSM